MRLKGISRNRTKMKTRHYQSFQPLSLLSCVCLHSWRSYFEKERTLIQRVTERTVVVSEILILKISYFPMRIFTKN